MSLKEIIKNEGVEEGLPFMEPTSDYRKPARLYTYNPFDVISGGELSSTCDDLFRKSVL